MPNIMNPYSFKRFLEHPERPRHPVQLVCTDANSILVHGELPDCVQNPGTPGIPPVVPDLNRTTSQSLSPHMPPTVVFPSNSRSMPEVSRSCYSDYVSSSPAHITASPLNMPLPDIHPSTSCENHQRGTPDSCRESINLDILPRILPDFITYTNCNEIVTPSAQQTISISSSNGPDCRQIPRRSVSFSGLPNVPDRTSLSVRSCYFRHSYSSLFPQFRDSRQGVAQSLTPPHPASLHVCSTSDLPAERAPNPQPTDCLSVPFLQHQQEVTALRNRQSELEDQLNRTRALLRDRESLLESVTAEFEVVKTRSALRIKALEHELAIERHRSAQDRWRLVQLHRRLAVQPSGGSVSPGTVLPDLPTVPPNGIPLLSLDARAVSINNVRRNDDTVSLQNGSSLSSVHNSTFGISLNPGSEFGLLCNPVSGDRRNSSNPSSDAYTS